MLVLDDIPEAIKRHEYKHQKAGATQVAQLVTNELLHPPRSECLDEDSLRGSSTRTNEVFRGGCVHTVPRQSLYDHKWHKTMSRLSIMFVEWIVQARG